MTLRYFGRTPPTELRLGGLLLLGRLANADGLAQMCDCPDAATGEHKNKCSVGQSGPRCVLLLPGQPPHVTLMALQPKEPTNAETQPS